MTIARLMKVLRYSLLFGYASIGQAAALEEPALPKEHHTTVDSKLRMDFAQFSSDEAELLLTLHEANLAEVQAGTLAQFKGQSQGVRDYGRMLVHDHLQNETRLIEIAGQQLLTLAPNAMNPNVMALALQHRLSFASLLLAPISEFDELFAKEMRDDHTKIIEKIESLLPRLENSQVAHLAKDTLVSLEMHQNMAQSLVIRLARQ